MDDAYLTALELSVAPQAGSGAAACRAEESADNFDAFVREQYPSLLQFLSRRSPNLEDAQDAAQESLARFVRYKREPAAAWKPLLYRIAINVLNDRSRQAQSHLVSRHVPFEGLEIESGQPTVEDAAIQAQQLALLREAILSLPPKCRQVYLLKRMRGMTNAAIAKQCGISVKMVEKHSATALLQLRRRLGQVSHDA